MLPAYQGAPFGSCGRSNDEMMGDPGAQSCQMRLVQLILPQCRCKGTSGSESPPPTQGSKKSQGRALRPLPSTCKAACCVSQTPGALDLLRPVRSQCPRQLGIFLQTREASVRRGMLLGPVSQGRIRLHRGRRHAHQWHGSCCSTAATLTTQAGQEATLIQSLLHPWAGSFCIKEHRAQHRRRRDGGTCGFSVKDRKRGEFTNWERGSHFISW